MTDDTQDRDMKLRFEPLLRSIKYLMITKEIDEISESGVTPNPDVT